MTKCDLNGGMELSRKLKHLMGLRNLSQDRLAPLLDVHQTQVSRWVNGKSVPTLVQARRIAEALQVPLSYLADDSQDDPPSSDHDEIQRRIWWLVQTMGYDVAERRLLAMEPTQKAPAAPERHGALMDGQPPRSGVIRGDGASRAEGQPGDQNPRKRGAG